MHLKTSFEGKEMWAVAESERERIPGLCTGETEGTATMLFFFFFFGKSRTEKFYRQKRADLEEL